MRSHFAGRWLKTFVVLLWASWFGGIVALFIFVQTIFHSVPHDTFVQTAPHLFFAFERYQLALAAIALATTLIWRLLGGNGRATMTFWFIAAATICCVVETAVITPRIEQLHLAGETHTPHFMKLHGTSMAVYLAESLVLLAIGLVLMWPTERETIPAAAPVK